MSNKNKFKVVILLIILFITSGCTVKYRLNINYDGTFDDSVVIEETKDNFERIGVDMESYVIDQYNINVEYFFYNEYYKQYLIRDDYSRVSGEHYGWSLEDFTHSSLFIKSAFENINVTNENNKLIFEATGNQMDLLFPGIHTDGAPELEYETIDLIITSDYKVLESNADEVNKLKNEYIWHFTSDDYNKEIYIEMDSKQTVLGKVTSKIRSNLTGIITLLVVAVIAIVGGIFFYKKYQDVNGV